MYRGDDLKDRAQVLGLLRGLPKSEVATDVEVLAFIERGSLMGRGIGYIDARLLAATCLFDGATAVDAGSAAGRCGRVSSDYTFHARPGGYPVVESRIADTFTDSLVNLAGDEQKAGKATALISRQIQPTPV